MNMKRIKELQQQIEDLKSRWPAHSVLPVLMDHLDDAQQGLTCPGTRAAIWNALNLLPGTPYWRRLKRRRATQQRNGTGLEDMLLESYGGKRRQVCLYGLDRGGFRTG